MSAVASKVDTIERQVKAGRKIMGRTFHLVEKQVKPVMSTRRAQVAAGAILFAFVALGVGVLVYRRRRPTLASRIVNVLPEDLRPRAIKRALG